MSTPPPEINGSVLLDNSQLLQPSKVGIHHNFGIALWNWAERVDDLAPHGLGHEALPTDGLPPRSQFWVAMAGSLLGEA